MVNFEKKFISVSVDGEHGWMAERSKAPVSGTGLFGGVGSNPTPIIFSSFLALKTMYFQKKKMDQPVCYPFDMVGWPSGLRR